MLCDAAFRLLTGKLIYLQAINFTLVDRVVSLIVSLHGTRRLSPKLSMDKRPVVSRMVKKVRMFDYTGSRSDKTWLRSFSDTSTTI